VFRVLEICVIRKLRSKRLGVGGGKQIPSTRLISYIEEDNDYYVLEYLCNFWSCNVDINAEGEREVEDIYCQQ
jgi:hypothetical protein